MRDRPFLSASEPTRPFSDVKAERGDLDITENVLRRIAEIEREATDLDDPTARAFKQCEAEDMRCALDEMKRRTP